MDMAYSVPERMAVGPPATLELKTMQPCPLAISSGWLACEHVT